MSDDFDKEAEREKLRKRFEQDKAEREAAQRMSDLLLKGATMTNKHCNECGDPVFRQNGQEFCPTCQREVDGQDAEQGNEASDTQAEARTEQGSETAQRATEQQAANTPETPSGQQEQSGQTDDAVPGQQPASRDSSTQQQPADRQPSPRQSAERQPADQQPADQRSPQQPSAQQPSDDNRSPQQPSTQQPTDQQPPHQPERTQPQARGSVGAARERLAAAIETHADRAVETEDPGEATEHLEAAREAAEALAALRRSQ